MSEELKPCPFCKGKAMTYFTLTNTPKQPLYYTTCEKCFCKTGYYLDEQAAISAWNMRS